MFSKQMIAIMSAAYVLMVVLGVRELMMLSKEGYMLPGLSFAFGTATIYGYGYIKNAIKSAS